MMAARNPQSPSAALQRMRQVVVRERPGGEQGSPPPEAPVQPSRASHSAPRPTRFTADLDPTLHRFLKQFAFAHEVDAVAVVRVLLQRLRDDPELAARVETELQAQGH